MDGEGRKGKKCGKFYSSMQTKRKNKFRNRLPTLSYPLYTR